MTEQVYDPKQINRDEILDENQRLVKAWGTVEIRDNQGQLLPTVYFKKLMPIIMERGGAIIDEHSNKQIGKILDYEFKHNPKANAEGVYLTYKIYNHFPRDNIVWQEIKSGKRKGLSFGGGGKIIDVDFSKGEPTAILAAVEGYEYSSVYDPANYYSVNEEINYIAKSGAGIEKGCTAKMKECIEKVKRESPGANAYAVCAAALGEQAFKSDSKELQILKSFDGGFDMKDVKKQDEAPQETEEQKPENNLEARVAALEEKMDAILEKLSATPVEETQKQSEEEKEKEKKKEETEEVQKQGDGEKVTLPKSEEEKTTEAAKPATDKVTVIEKKDISDLKKEVIEDVKKSLQSGSTPRPDTADPVDKASVQGAAKKGISAYDIAVGKQEFDSREYGEQLAEERDERIRGILSKRGDAQ